MLPKTSGACVLTGEAACLRGEHVAVNPHKQRLLVAANKAAKLPKAKAKPKAKAIARPQEPAASTTANLNPDAEAVAAAPKKGGKPKKAADTGYSDAKKKFIAE